MLWAAVTIVNVRSSKHPHGSEPRRDLSVPQTKCCFAGRKLRYKGSRIWRMGQGKPFLLAWLAFCGIIVAMLTIHALAFPGLNEGMDFRQLYTGGFLLR